MSVEEVDLLALLAFFPSVINQNKGGGGGRASPDPPLAKKQNDYSLLLHFLLMVLFGDTVSEMQNFVLA